MYSFVEAIMFLKKGYKVRHDGWAEGVYLFKVDGRVVRSSIDERYGGQWGQPEREVHDAIYIKTSRGSLVPWLPGHVELLSDTGWVTYDKSN